MDAVAEASYLAFGVTAGENDRKYFRAGFDVSRALCAFEGGRIVGTASSLSLGIALPGGRDCRVGGPGWLAVVPTHTRRGIMTRLIRGLCDDVRERGEPLCVLTASEGSIYRRFGFGPATRLSRFKVDAAHAGFASTPAGFAEQQAVAGAGSRLTLLTQHEAATILPALHERLRRSEPGSVTRSAAWWDCYLADGEHYFRGYAGAGPMFHAVHRGSDCIPDGYVTYRMNTTWMDGRPRQTLVVIELLSASPATYERLWSYCLGVDLVQEVSCERGRVDEPLRWLLADTRRLETGGLIDHMWLRLVDIPAALEARSYRGTGDLTIRVVDRFLPENEGSYRLVVESSGAECCRVERRADLEIDVADLGSLYLGDVTFAVLACSGRVREQQSGALGVADRLFAVSRPPFCNTQF